jgi:hypothetical protein
MKLSVQTDIRGFQRNMETLRKDQIPFATAYALTQTAIAAQKEVEREIPRVFDNPTPFTRQAIRIRPATKRRLQSEVLVKDFAAKGNAAVKWLMAEIYGGPRNLKAFERLLSWAGAMPAGWYAVPTNYAPRDQYGNVPGSAINQILSQLQARRDVTANESAAQRARRNSDGNRSKRRLSRYFAVLPGRERTAHLKPGIYERVAFGFGTSVRPVFIYTPNAPRYRPRLRFAKIVKDTVQSQFGLQFRRGFALAARTAK